MRRIIFVTLALIAALGSGIPADAAQAGYSLAGFSTEFNPKQQGRSTNIRLAAQAIDRVLVNPGEQFSFNAAVGPTTKENGFALGIIYVDGQKDKGYGGGVCQVSTTLYNAAVKAGLTITERHDHSLPVDYVEAGQEAATSYGVLDFKFVNELSFPIMIRSNAEGGKISVSILAL